MDIVTSAFVLCNIHRDKTCCSFSLLYLFIVGVLGVFLWCSFFFRVLLATMVFLLPLPNLCYLCVRFFRSLSVCFGGDGDCLSIFGKDLCFGGSDILHLYGHIFLYGLFVFSLFSWVCMSKLDRARKKPNPNQTKANQTKPN